jgi:hypothetical protein
MRRRMLQLAAGSAALAVMKKKASHNPPRS